MKSFLEEYGFAILAAIVVITLIMVTTPAGSMIKHSISTIVLELGGKTEEKIADYKNLNVELRQVDDEGKMLIKLITNSSTDVFLSEYRTKDQNNNWGDWQTLMSLSTGDKEHYLFYKAEIENGYACQARVYRQDDEAKQHFESNIIEYTGSASNEELFGFPQKGDVIEIEGHEYRLLSMNKTTAKLLSQFKPSEEVLFNTSTNNYFGGPLDEYLNKTIYNSLPANIRNNIVETLVTQYEYEARGSDSSSFTNFAITSTKKSLDSQKRNIYAVDVEDIEEYLGQNYTTNDIKNMFKIESNIWLRSAVSGFPQSVYFVNSTAGNVGYTNITFITFDPFYIMNIDLSKIAWSIEIPIS